MKNFNGKQIAKKLGADKFRHNDDFREDVLYFMNDDGIQEIYTIIDGGKIILYDISYNINKPSGFFSPIIEIRIPIEVFINTFSRKRYAKPSFWRMANRQLKSEHDALYRKHQKTGGIKYYIDMLEISSKIDRLNDNHQSIIMIMKLNNRKEA